MSEDDAPPSPDGDGAPTRRMLNWAKNSTLYRLEQRMMTERQLFDAICRKARQKFDGISPEQVRALADAAIAFAYDIKGLDDTAYADIATQSAVRNGKSKRAIAQKLSATGVSREVASLALENTDDLRAAIILARKRRFGPFRREGEVDAPQRAKEIATFARNGFGFAIAQRVVAMEKDEAEALLSEPQVKAWS